MKVKINYFDLGLHDAQELFEIYPYLNNSYHNWNAYGFEACDLFHDFCQERFKLEPRIEIIHGAISNTEDDVKLHYAENAVGHSIFESKNKELKNLFNEKRIYMPMMFDYYEKESKKPHDLKKWVSLTKKWAKSQGLRLRPDPEGPDFQDLNEQNFEQWRSHRSISLITYEDGYHDRPTGEICKGIVFSKWLKKNVPDFEKSFNILRVNIEGAEAHLFKDLIENDLVKHFDIFCGTGHDVEKIPEISAEEHYKMLEGSNIKMYRFSDWKPELNDRIFDIIEEKLKKYENKNVLP